jgi:hypothetical protein
METIPDLVAHAVKADVLKRPLVQIRIDPESEDPLVGPTKLAGAREHAATIDPDRKIEGAPVFERQIFGSELGRPIK